MRLAIRNRTGRLGREPPFHSILCEGYPLRQMRSGPHFRTAFSDQMVRAPKASGTDRAGRNRQVDEPGSWLATLPGEELSFMGVGAGISGW